jgi:hypothetical protein
MIWDAEECSPQLALKYRWHGTDAGWRLKSRLWAFRRKTCLRRSPRGPHRAAILVSTQVDIVAAWPTGAVSTAGVRVFG